MFRNYDKRHRLHTFGRHLLVALAAAIVAPVVVCADDAASKHQQMEFFESRIRPVLVEKCYSCHSETSKKLKGDLKVDSAAGLLRGGESGSPSVVPGDLEKSKLIEAIRYKTEDLQMPPKEKLSAAVVADFEAWVKMGAPDPRTATSVASLKPATGSPEDVKLAKREWWSFIAPKAATPPSVKNAAWVKTPVDAFILAKLEEKGLAPSPQADRRTLLRRITFDLTGLPPTAEEVAAFEADKSAGAYEKVVDRLLASPHYGERWGRYWLDICRYADTKGYVFQEERRYPYAYAFRDWVIQSFNNDLPYDQFVMHQLAADKLATGEDKRGLAAMGFLTVGRRFLNNQADIIDDRIDVMSRGLLAMSLACARCHDHKFDPIPTKDYYSLYGVFASSEEPAEGPELRADGKVKSAQTVEFEKKLQGLKDAADAYLHERYDAMLAEARSAAALTNYLQLLHTGKQYTDLSGVDKGKVNRRFYERWRAYLARVSKDPKSVFAAWAALEKFPDAQIAAHIEEAAKASANPLVAAALREKSPKTLAEVADVYAALLTKYAGAEPRKDAHEEQLRQVLFAETGPTGMKFEETAQALNKLEKAKYSELQKKVDALKVNDPGSPARAMVMVDRAQPVQPRVFKRGNPSSPGDAVPRAFLSVLSPDDRQPFKEGSGRLEMAKAIASKDNPLTARVMVNRVWLHHFGQGIVRTPSDFGRRGELPTHPELLDYLAVKFMDDGWSVKKLHKAIVMSAAYQQASNDVDKARMADPENRLLWRQNRQRLDFEAMRDSVLVATGQLDATMFGKPVDLAAQPAPKRRTIYGFIDRQNLPNMFRAFDFASPDSHSPQRYFTTVPQQALYMMNSPFAIESARALANRPDVVKETSPEKRIARLYALVLDRAPYADELSMGVEFVKNEEAAGVVAQPAPPPIWQYGYGTLDEAGRTKNFQRLPHFNGSAWQGGPNVPDPSIGWALLTKDGGHPGDDEHMVIRRWMAPEDMTVLITGTLKHTANVGPGVRGRIVSSRAGVLGTWAVKDGKGITANVPKIDVKAGETIDFVVDANGGLNSNSFAWAPTVRTVGKGAQTWSAAKDFSGSLPVPVKPLTPWEKYAQVLLETNEFVFVD